MNTEANNTEATATETEAPKPKPLTERLTDWVLNQPDAPCRRWSYEIEAVNLGQVAYRLERLGMDTTNDPSVTGGDECECDCDECVHSCDCDQCDITNGWGEANHCGNCSTTEACPSNSQPVITTHDSDRLPEACEALRQVARIDDTCGGHIHIDASDLSAQQVATVMRLWRKVNELLPELIGRDPNHYAELNDEYDFEAILDTNPRGERYKSVNAVNWIQAKNGSYNHTKTTLEFRQFAGTLNAELITARGFICRALVEYAVKGAPIYWISRETSPEAFLRELGINIPASA